jgi:hypothetical protein
MVEDKLEFIRLLSDKDDFEVFEEDDFYSRNKGWIRGLTIAFAIQALIGFIAVEYAFSRLNRFRDGNEERDSKFPAYRRLDVKNWNKCKFYPGAMFTMPARLMILIIQGLILALLCT